MRISFDYDGTITIPKIKEFAKMLIDFGADICILTSRQDDSIYENEKLIGYHGNNTDLRELCKEIGLPLHKVFYVNGDNKVDEYIRLAIDIHFDNDYGDCELIRRSGGTAFFVEFDMHNIADIFINNKDNLERLLD